MESKDTTVFILHRGASINAEITSSYFSRPLLVQGGLQITFRISIKSIHLSAKQYSSAIKI